MTDPTRMFVREFLEALKLDAVVFETYVCELEAAGHRIVSGGQGPENHQWLILDARTGEVIAQGDDGVEGYDSAVNRLDPDEHWLHVDHVWENAPEVVPVSDHGLPESLADALIEWVESGGEDEDIAEWAGVPLAEVRHARSAREIGPLS